MYYPLFPGEGDASDLLKGKNANDPLVKELGALHATYFNHTVDLEQECKNFIKVFEQRRNNNDMKALEEAGKLMEKDFITFSNAKLVSDSNFETLFGLLKETTSLLQENLGKEEEYQVIRKEERRIFVEEEQKVRDKILNEQEETNKNILEDFRRKKKEIEEKYKIPSISN